MVKVKEIFEEIEKILQEREKKKFSSNDYVKREAYIFDCNIPPSPNVITRRFATLVKYNGYLRAEVIQLFTQPDVIYKIRETITNGKIVKAIIYKYKDSPRVDYVDDIKILEPEEFKKELENYELQDCKILVLEKINENTFENLQDSVRYFLGTLTSENKLKLASLPFHSIVTTLAFTNTQRATTELNIIRYCYIFNVIEKQEKNKEVETQEIQENEIQNDEELVRELQEKYGE